MSSTVQGRALCRVIRSPRCVYGASKEAGERGVRAANPDHIILRTAWVVSPWGNNFVKTMLLGAERDQLRVVADQHGCPTSAIDIADALLAILVKGGPAGTGHFVNQGEASWCDLARFVVHRAGLGAEVEAIATADYPDAGETARRTRLSTVLQDGSAFRRARGRTPSAR